MLVTLLPCSTVLSEIVISHDDLYCDGPICFPTYLSILCVFKNEAPFLAEWVEYHLLVGVTRFWLYDNDSEDDAFLALRPYIALGLVQLQRWPGRGQQKFLYTAALPFLRNQSFWVSILDVDEFLVPVDGHSVPDIMRRFEAHGGVGINWLVYSINGLMLRDDRLVIERFKAHTEWDNPLNRHTKTIVNPRRVLELFVHSARYPRGQFGRNVIDEKLSWNMLGTPPVHKVLRINHYWTKSLDEFIRKRARGRASVPQDDSGRLLRLVLKDLARAEDLVTNDTAMDWAIPLVKQNLAARRISEF
jgi:hypothetical protein